MCLLRRKLGLQPLPLSSPVLIAGPAAVQTLKHWSLRSQQLVRRMLRKLGR
ncbi:hypothetical protein D3C75_1027990 [compost metagenome]